MVRYLVMFIFLSGVVLLHGCVKVQVDKPLVDLGGDRPSVKPVSGEPSGEQAKINWLRRELTQCQEKLEKLKDKYSRLKDKNDELEDKIEDLEEENEDLHKRLNR